MNTNNLITKFLVLVSFFSYAALAMSQQNIVDNALEVVKKTTVADLLKKQETKASKLNTVDKAASSLSGPVLNNEISGIISNVKKLLPSVDSKFIDVLNTKTPNHNTIEQITPRNSAISQQLNNKPNPSSPSQQVEANAYAKGIQLYAVYGFAPNLRAVLTIDGDKVDLGKGESSRGMQLISVIENKVQVSSNGKTLNFTIQQ